MWTGSTDLSRIGKGHKGKKRKNPNDYKPPARKVPKAMIRGIRFQRPETRDKPTCGCVLEGEIRYKRGLKKAHPHDKYGIRIVVGTKCNAPATVSYRDPNSGTNVHRCAKHIGVEYIDKEGETHSL
jgi:hypothetical protein